MEKVKEIPMAKEKPKDALDAELEELKGVNLETVDLDLPELCALRIASQARYAHVRNYYQVQFALKGARIAGNENEVKRLHQALAGERASVAVIDHAYPDAKSEMTKLALQDVEAIKSDA